MSNGSYDRRAPSAASQIITLERLLEESEERKAELVAELDIARAAHHWVVLERDNVRKEKIKLKQQLEATIAEKDRVVEAVMEELKGQAQYDCPVTNACAKRCIEALAALLEK